MKEYTFKEMDRYIRFVFKSRKRVMLQNAMEIREDNETYLNGKKMCEYIEYTLSCCDEQTRAFIVAEYVEGTSGWWYDLYSHSTYYRMKKHAMEEFLRYLRM